ncbi:MAG: zf-HC2 domain-containing protein [Caldithrix sp.]|nr:MAG: zf-HC2 domain-containing protein [Caldithrix sp.]
MKCEHVTRQIADYLGGNLNDSALSKIEEHLLSCSACKAEFESLGTTWEKLGKLPEATPPATVKARFYAMLEAYEAGQNVAAIRLGWREKVNNSLGRWWPQQPVFQFGLALALLIIGLISGLAMKAPSQGNQDLMVLRNEVYSLRQMVATALLQNQSSSERLRGVSYSYRVAQPEATTLETLLNTLDYDSNLNVRLATIDALSIFYDEEVVRAGLIESLTRQTSPLTQIALIELFVERQEKQAVSALKLLMNNEMFNQTVRRRAGKAIKQLK